MSHEMRAGRVVGTTHKIAGVEVVIKTNALRADSGLKLAFRAIAQLWHPHAIEIPKNRSIGLVPRIECLARFPRNLPAHSKLVFQEQMSSAERQIGSTIQWLRTEDECRCGRFGRSQSAHAESHIRLSRRKCTQKNKHHAKPYKRFHYPTPPFLFRTSNSTHSATCPIYSNAHMVRDVCANHG